MAQPLTTGPNAVNLGLAPEPAASAATSKTLLSSPDQAVRRGVPAHRVVLGPHCWIPVAILSDTVAIALSFVVGAAARQPLGPREGPSFDPSLLRELPFLPIFILVMAAYSLYHRDRRRVRQTSFLDMGSRTHALAVGAVTSLAASHLAFRLVGTPKLGWVEVAFMSLPAVLLVPLGRTGAAVLLRRLGAMRSRVVVVGSGSVATSLADRLQRYPDIQLLGFVDDEPYFPRGEQHHEPLGTIADLPRVCAATGADRVLVAFSHTSPVWVAEMLRRLPANVRVSIVPRLFELVTWQSHIEELHGLTVMDIAPPRLGWFNRATKRAMDIAVSAGLLVALSPLMVLAAIAVKISSPGPVLFRQPRVGYRGITFEIFKFRTMDMNADEVKIDLRERSDVDGPLFKLHNDPRVTTVGRFLRPTSIDELPQLLNVLLGQMSLVGPRPFVIDESAEISGWATRRFDVRPGMTGLWQISGRNDLPFEELQQLDYAYVASWSLWWDLKILWHTPGTVFRRHGAY